MKRSDNNARLSLFLTLCGIGIIAVLFTAISIYVNKIEIIYGVKFISFQFFGMLLPGMALVVILKYKSLSTIEFCGLSYAMGYIINIIEYYILFPLNLKKYAIYLIPVIALVSIIIIYKEKLQFKEIIIDKKACIICFFFIIILLPIAFLVYNCANLPPNIMGNEIYYPDLVFWIGNTISAEHGYIPIDLRAIGQPLYYHFFSNLQLALLKNVTYISAIHLSYCLQYIQPILIMVFGSSSLFKKVLKKNKYTFLAMFVLFLTAGIEWDTFMLFVSHLIIEPFGFDISFGFSMFFIYFIVIQIEKAEFQLNIFIGALLTFIVVTGSKGPIGCVLLCGVGIWCFYLLFIKKEKKLSLIYGISILLSFLLIYFFVLSNPSPSASTTIGVEWFNTIRNIPEFNGFYEYLNSLNVPVIFSQVITIIYWILANNQFIYTLVGFAIILLIINYKKIEILDIILFVITVVGIILTLLIKQEGLSQMYFMLASYPFALLFGFRIYIIFKDKIFFNLVTKILSNIVLIGLIGVVTYDYLFIISPNISKGYDKIKYKYKSEYAVGGVSQAFSESDYEGLIYLKNNSDEDSVVLSDRATVCDMPKYFCYGIFSERQMYLEGPAYSSIDSKEVERRQQLIKEVMSNNYSSLEKVKKEGVNYIVQTKTVTPDFYCPNEYGEKIFENTSLVIYKLK